MATVLTQQVYPASTVISASVAWPMGSVEVTASAIMSDADALNATNTCTFTIAASYDSQGLTFERKAVAPWQGGVVAPGVSWRPGTVLPTYVRVEIDLPQAISIGADLGLS